MIVGMIVFMDTGLHEALRLHGEADDGSWMRWMVSYWVDIGLLGRWRAPLVEEVRVTVMLSGRVDSREVWVSWRWSVCRAVVAILCSTPCGLVCG